MTRKLLYLTLTLLTLLLPAACSTDEPFRPGEGETMLNILIPSTELARENTRAEGLYDDEHGTRLVSEGMIKKLRVAGFYEEEGTNVTRHFYAELDPNHATAVNDIYLNYSMSVVPGDYRLYIFANMELNPTTKSKLQAEATAAGLEEEVQEISHSYVTNSKVTLPTAEEGLPMANKNALSVTVAKGERQTLEAKLGFLCSKVRVSVIYDKAFGETEKFKINSMDALNVWTGTRVFAGLYENAANGTGTSKNTLTGVGKGNHYALGEIASMTLEELAAITDENEDPLNKLGTALNDPTGYTQCVWQSTVYLPECNGKTEEERTALRINPDGVGSFSFIPGCFVDGSGNEFKMERGHFYDIIAKVAEGGEVQYSWTVNGWDPFRLTVQLAGTTELSLSMTRITEEIDGMNPATIYYNSNAPRLEFDIDKDENGVDYFIITEDKASKTITVRVNPEIGIHANLITGKTFRVIAGNINKQVVVDAINMKAYLHIYPDSQSLNLKDIANSNSFSFYLDYSTNVDGLALKISQITNSNTNKQYTTSGGNVTGGAYLEVVSNDTTTVLSEKIALLANTNIGDKMKTGVTLPKSGLLRITVVDPTSATFFASQIAGKIVGTADGGYTDDGSFTIVPNPTKYVIHFKAVRNSNGDIDTGWQNDQGAVPHIYIYQPLYYKGYPVYGQSGSDKINWIEYSFTGNYAFKGWYSGGGDVDDLMIDTSTFQDKTGSDITGYNVESTWGDPGTPSGVTDNMRYQKINLLGSFRGTCSTCHPNTGESNQSALWPGVGMLKETGDNAGWYRIELPLLAKPGSAMVMFTNNHSGTYRYPLAAMPGIPLPNYADCEAWYLLDTSIGGDNCYFTDDRHDSYAD